MYRRLCCASGTYRFLSWKSYFGRGQYQNGMINRVVYPLKTMLRLIYKIFYKQASLPLSPWLFSTATSRSSPSSFCNTPLASQRMLTPYAVSLQINTPTSRVPQHKCTRSGDPESMPEVFFAIFLQKLCQYYFPTKENYKKLMQSQRIARYIFPWLKKCL